MFSVCRVLCASGVTFFLALALAPAGLAQGRDPREVQAHKDCLKGNYASGIALLADLFVETNNPNLVYNQARCYEQNGRPDDAILRFREYLRIARNLAADDKAEVERHIAECKAAKAEQGQGAAPTAGAIVAPPTAGPSAAPPIVVPRPSPAIPATAQPGGTEPGTSSSPGPAPAAVKPAPTEPGSSPPPAAGVVASTGVAAPQGGGSGLRTWGVVVGSVGVVAVGAGVVFGVLTKRTQQEVESDVHNGFFDAGKDSNGHRYETLQWVGYGVGAAAIVAGTIMFLVGGPASQPSGGQSVAVAPIVGPARGGLLLQGGF